MMSNNELLKLFVKVPAGASFNGAAVSGATNEKRLFFEEATGLIWAKGQRYGITAEQATALQTLIGSDSSKSVREIADEVCKAIIGIGDDANATIDRLKEVLDWFNTVSETETGAGLIQSVAANTAAIGVKKVLYTAETAAAYNTEHAEDPDFEEVHVGDVAVAATGLYKYVDDKVQAATPEGFSELVNDVDNLGNRVEALEEFDPWEDYVDPLVAPVISGETPFDYNTTVTITGPLGSTIHYTTDGSDPTSESDSYDNPFELLATTTVKAIAIRNTESSPVATKVFTLSSDNGDNNGGGNGNG